MAWHDIRDGSPLKRSLREGRPVFGCFIRLPCAEAVEVCAHAGFDFLVIDAEHGPLGDDAVAGLVRAGEAADIAVLVRAPSPGSEHIGRLLDAGPFGIHVPQVHDADQAREVIRAIKHPPEGTRGLATGRASGYGLRMSLADYVEAANREMAVILQLETVSALGQVEEIAAVPGVDVIFVGLTDLSLDLGVPGQYDHPEIVRSVTRARRATEDTGIALGVPVASAAMARELIDQGARYLATNDIRLLSGAATSFLAEVRGAVRSED